VHQLTQSLRCNQWKIQNRGDSHNAINSIRRSAAERLQAMTSVFYDVIRLKAIHGSLNMPTEGPFLTVFGEFEPQNVFSHRVDPKKALPYVTMRTLSYCAPISMHGSLH